MDEEQKTHVHVLEDGTVVEHSHEEHVHHHSHAHTKAVLNRDVKSHWTYGIHQAYDRGRQGLQRSSDTAVSSEICHQ